MAIINDLLNALWASGRLHLDGWRLLAEHLKGLDLQKMKPGALAAEIDLTVFSINARLAAAQKEERKS